MSKLGEGGIRTLGTLLGYGALAKRCFRPLSHLTKNGRPEYRGDRPGVNRVAELARPGGRAGLSVLGRFGSSLQEFIERGVFRRRDIS